MRERERERFAEGERFARRIVFTALVDSTRPITVDKSIAMELDHLCTVSAAKTERKSKRDADSIQIEINSLRNQITLP